MSTIAPTTSLSSDVLHNQNHQQLSQEAIAKALARHQREHPSGRRTSSAANPQKTAPRH